MLLSQYQVLYVSITVSSTVCLYICSAMSGEPIEAVYYGYTVYCMVDGGCCGSSILGGQEKVMRYSTVHVVLGGNLFSVPHHHCDRC